MTRYVFKDASEAAMAVSERIVTLLGQRPHAVLGLATGATMEPVYAALVTAHRMGRVSFSRAASFNLDEYVGLPAQHPASYRSTMNRLLFDHIDIDPARTHVPNGLDSDPHRAAAAYEALIATSGPIDLQLLGIGRNGHIGFNEPGSSLNSRTRLVELHAETLQANRAFFADGAVPRQAITMGIAGILSARSIVVLATGTAKQAAIARSLAGHFDADCPASALSEHGDVSWYLDDNAASATRAA
ncbi:glucosamine-6-phosphate deaminase [Rhizobium sp. FY34]|uniref:glucosamine-6-phosphate deaminase n=1 Tax=Rhizobium sp. FY34 TaxID=2562309 RepID=UPI0010BFBC65|nr:glucosamine-6-phosphate deaminase [Rhizobium sp. FY34]